MTQYTTVDRIFLDRLQVAIDEGSEKELEALLAQPWRPFHTPVIDAFGDRHVRPSSGFEVPVRNRLVRLYPRLTSPHRAQLLDHALACGDEALGGAILARMPAGDVLPWASWLDRQRRTEGADWPMLRTARMGTDHTGNTALGGLVRMTSALPPDEARAAALTLLPRLLLAAAPLNDVGLVLPMPSSPMTALRAAFHNGQPELAQGLIAAGARMDPWALTVVAEAWLAKSHFWRPEEPETRALPTTWHELTHPSKATVDAWFGDPAYVARYARCWEVASAAGARSDAAPSGKAAPAHHLGQVRPDWLALWAAHDMGRHLPEAPPVPQPRPRL